jgi:hypothetical protein
VEHERLELVVAEHVDAALEARRVVEIADEHGEAAALVLRDEGLHGVAEVGRALGLQRAQEAEDPEDARLAAGRLHAAADLVGGDDGDPVEVREADVRERRAQALRVRSFSPSPKAIDEEVSTMK